MAGMTHTGILVSLLLIVSRFSDVVITFSITPDLAQELNVLTVYGGAQWGVLILATTLVLLLTIPLFWFYLYMHRGMWPQERGVRFGSFLSRFFLGEERPAWHILFRPTPTWRRKGVLLGLTIPWVVAAVSFTVDILTALALRHAGPRALHMEIAARYYLLVIPFVALIVLSALVGEYVLYRNQGQPVQAERGKTIEPPAGVPEPCAPSTFGSDWPWFPSRSRDASPTRNLRPLRADPTRRNRALQVCPPTSTGPSRPRSCAVMTVRAATKR